MNAGIVFLSIAVMLGGLTTDSGAPFTSAGHPEAMKMLSITREQNGTDVNVEENSMFRIELQSLGGAGYGWYVDIIDTRYVEVISETTEDGSAKGMTGAPVLQVFQLQAKREGQTEIRLLYYRVWEGKEKAADSFSVRLIITKARDGI